jgi:hypothetical protein
MAHKICLPNDISLRNLILTENHSNAGYPDLNRALLNVSKMFWWPLIRKTVITHYCKTCATCQRIMIRTTKPLGSLLPLPKATRHWEIISMDFVIGLPIVDGFDCITTFDDSFTKQAHSIPCSIHISAPKLARLFLDNINRHHGLCHTTISDRDPKFISTFWQTFFKSMQTKLIFSCSYHPQNESLTEPTHIRMEQNFVLLLTNNIKIGLSV